MVMPARMAVLITGASRGLGLALCKAYGSAGHRVLACCRSPEKVKDLRSLDVEVLALDVADHTSIADLKVQLGNQPIDLLINNAGVAGGDHQGFGGIDYSAWEETLITNTFGPYRMVEAFAENIVASKRKMVANISSQMGSIAAYDEGGDYIYRSSKTALNMVTHNLAVDLRPRGITFLALHPGWVRTDMGGKDAPVTPTESAEGLMRVIEDATLNDTGGFFSFNGDRVPW